jgi:hypothetical protein
MLVHNICKKPVEQREGQQVYNDGTLGKDYYWYCVTCGRDVYDVEVAHA